MPGLSYSLNVGLSGLRSAQSALGVVGHNIANVNTPGYTRQRAVLAANSNQLFGGLYYGAGTGVSSVDSVRNKFLDIQILQNTSVKSGLDVRYQALEGISPAFDPSADASLSAVVQKFFQGFQDLAARPEDGSLRTNVLGTAQAMVIGLKERYNVLTQQRNQANQSVASLVSQVNGLLGQITSLNDQISSESPSGSNNDARDQRKAITDKLASLIGVTAYEAIDGTYTVMLDSGSAPLVVGHASYSLSVTPNPANNNYNDVLVSLGGAATYDATSRISGGELGAQLDLRDNLLSGYSRQLDQIAAGIQAQVNQLHRTGVALNGVTSNLDFFQGGVANYAASNLPLGEIAGLPATVSSLNNYQGMVNSLSINNALVANPSLVAAAGVPGAAGDNANARAIANLQSALNTVDTNGDGLGDSGPFSTSIGSLASSIGTQTSTFQTSSTTQENLLAGLQNQRDSISGVDLDEEASNLMSYQRAYQASARFLSVIDQLTDQLVNQFGR
jgi:flagellar hook-associated protein 1 FlgK